MTYGIGLMDLGSGSPAPIICIRYLDWSHTKLEFIRDSFKSGIVLTNTEREPGVHHIDLATRKSITIEHADGEHTSVLRAPAWDAHLEGVDAVAWRVFQANRRRRGGFLLFVQAGEWEFMTAVDGDNGLASVGGIAAASSMTRDPG